MEKEIGNTMFNANRFGCFLFFVFNTQTDKKIIGFFHLLILEIFQFNKTFIREMLRSMRLSSQK